MKATSPKDDKAYHPSGIPGSNFEPDLSSSIRRGAHRKTPPSPTRRYVT